MPTYRTGILRDNGFTLLELVFVLFIISFFIALAFPSFNFIGSKNKNEFRKFASLVRYLNDSSVNRREVFEMTVDLDRKLLQWNSPEGKRESTFNSLKSIYVTSKGNIMKGSLKIFFSPSGLDEFIKAYFSDGKNIISVSYNPYSRRVVTKKIVDQ